MPNRIKELRKAKNLSREALAERINSSDNMIYRLERGERGLTDVWMKRIAKGLECWPSDLLPDEDFNPRLDPLDVQLLQQFSQLSPKNRSRFLTIMSTVATMFVEREQDQAVAPGSLEYDADSEVNSAA